MTDFIIDAFEFSALAQHKNGQIAILQLPRLLSQVVGKSESLEWELQGNINKSGFSQLTLDITGLITLNCQRCFEPLPLPLSLKAILIMAKNENQADEIAETLINDEIDVIVGSKEFNLAELIEDEILLALPISYKHDDCAVWSNEKIDTKPRLLI